LKTFLRLWWEWGRWSLGERKEEKAKVEGKSSENENPTEWNEMVLKRNTLVPIWNDDKLELAKDSIIAEKREGFHLYIAYTIKTQIISPDVYDDVGHDGKIWGNKISNNFLLGKHFLKILNEADVWTGLVLCEWRVTSQNKLTPWLDWISK
jgi:hypothetical protein